LGSALGVCGERLGRDDDRRLRLPVIDPLGIGRDQVAASSCILWRSDAV
jgi:hypothetical protein